VAGSGDGAVHAGWLVAVLYGPGADRKANADEVAFNFPVRFIFCFQCHLVLSCVKYTQGCHMMQEKSEKKEKRFFDRIRGVRLRMDVNQEKFAKILGISKKTVQNWEKGKHAPQPGQMRNIATLLHVPISFLSGEDDDPGADTEVLKDAGTGKGFYDVVNKDSQVLCREHFNGVMEDCRGIDSRYNCVLHTMRRYLPRGYFDQEEKVSSDLVYHEALGVAEMIGEMVDGIGPSEKAGEPFARTGVLPPVAAGGSKKKPLH
jgi:transcriptional regulator with XRE-family HTH domain